MWILEKGSIVPICIQLKETELAEGTWKISELKIMRYLQFSKAAVVCLAGKTSGARKFPLHYIAFMGIAVLPTSPLAFTPEPFPSFLLSAHRWMAEALSAQFSCEVTAWWQCPRRRREALLSFWSLLLALCFKSCASCISSLAHLPIPGDPGKEAWTGRDFHQAIHTWKITPLFSHWFLCYAMMCTNFFFHFLSTFWPCLFIYLSFDFFSVDFIGGFDPFPLYHVNEKPTNLLFKQTYL